MSSRAGQIYENPANSELLALVVGSEGQALDIGCGAGANACALENRGWQVDGLTISEAEAHAARAFARSVIVCDLENGLPTGIGAGYDAAVLSHVLEHIAYPEKLLHDLHGVLSESGRIYVALPNIMHYKSRLRLVLGRFDYEDHGTWDRTHLRWYTFRSGQELLKRNGFVIEYAGASGGLPFGRITSRILGARRASSMAHWLCNSRPGLFGGQLLYVARTAESIREETNLGGSGP